jgi:hypothetical protein
VRGIGFNFVGGAFYGRDAFHTTEREFLAEHVNADHVASGDVAKADA